MDYSSSITVATNDVFRYSCYFSLLAFLLYCLAEAISTRRLVKSQAEYPLVGTRVTFVPRFLLNLLYAWKGTDLAKEGYEKVCSIALLPRGVAFLNSF